MAVTNTGIVLRTITGVNESDLFLDSESTSVATNTGIVERSIVGVHDANFVHPLGDEEISNGDFSNGSTGWQNPTYATDNSASLSVDDNALKIEKNANLDWRSSFVSQTPITYVSGKTYKITYSLKDGTTSGTDVYVRTNFSRSANTVNVKALTNDWVEYTDYYVADTSADDISFGVLAWQNAGVGQYYFVDNVSVKEVLVNRESTATNTGIVERPITGVNDGGDLFLDESTSVVNNTGIVERPITGVNESDALFPDNTESTVVNISDIIIPLLTALEARATTFENREGTINTLINLQKC